MHIYKKPPGPYQTKKSLVNVLMRVSLYSGALASLELCRKFNNVTIHASIIYRTCINGQTLSITIGFCSIPLKSSFIANALPISS